MLSTSDFKGEAESINRVVSCKAVIKLSEESKIFYDACLEDEAHNRIRMKFNLC